MIHPVYDVIYREYKEIDETNISCIICSEDFDNYSYLMGHKTDDKVSHVFHEKCLRAWFQEKSTCPICRDDIQNAIMTAKMRAAEVRALVSCCYDYQMITEMFPY